MYCTGLLTVYCHIYCICLQISCHFSVFKAAICPGAQTGQAGELGLREAPRCYGWVQFGFFAELVEHLWNMWCDLDSRSRNFGRFFGRWHSYFWWSIVLTRTQIFWRARKAFQMPQAICTARRWTFWHAQFFQVLEGPYGWEYLRRIPSWFGIVGYNVHIIPILD